MPMTKWDVLLAYNYGSCRVAATAAAGLKMLARRRRQKAHGVGLYWRVTDVLRSDPRCNALNGDATLRHLRYGAFIVVVIIIIIFTINDDL
jgi:Na+/H+-translocating membrane pyrophosphatase